jgi:hypothetical protein
MLQDFFTSALIIDDKESEVKDLISYLEEIDIWVKHFTPAQLNKRKEPFNNRKLIFLDLFLDNSKGLVDNIALIRKYLKKILKSDFGTYGIVLWTKHEDNFDQFCDKIYNKSNNFTFPLFIVSLDKTKYSSLGNYKSILNDLETKLSSDVYASFFIEWNKAVKKGSDNTISTLYNLFDSNTKKTQNLESVLYSLAINYTGIPRISIKKYDLQKDLVKSLMDTLQFEITENYNNTSSLFSVSTKLNYNPTEEIEKNEKIKIYSMLNSLLLLDFNNYHQDSVIPGNVYEVRKSNNPVYIENIFKGTNEIELEKHADFIGKVNKRIAIEVTPPCDFAGMKKQFHSRVLGGFVLDYDNKLIEKYFKGDGFYAYLLPIFLKEFTNPQMIIIDFYRFQTIKETELRNNKKFKIIMTVKNKLFADILQKLSSHTSRLGIPIMNPNL